MAQDTQYLAKKGNVWLVVVEVPKPLREAIGQPRLKVSLQTSNLAEANRKKHSYVAAFKARIDEAKRKQGNPKAAALRDAGEWRKELETANRSPVDVGERTEHVPYEELLSVVKDLARQLHERDPDLGTRYLKAATGEGTLVKDYIAPFITEVVCAEQTKVQHKSTINRYLTWAGELTTVEEADRVKAGEYVTELLTASGLSRATIKRHLSSLSQYWLWLESKGHARSNPWLSHRLGKKKQGATRKGLPDEKVLKVLRGTYSTQKFAQVLKDLSRLALLHGARLDELCALKKADVHKRADGLWLVIGGGKTEAAARELPVHTKAVPIIERRLKGEGEFLFDGLEPGGPDGKRSWYVSKAYGRFRRQIGVDAPFEDFHSLRNTFIECMEGLEVAESTTKLLVGHKRVSMTYGHYSKGQRVSLRAALDKLDYGSTIMSAI
jgi:integrase